MAALVAGLTLGALPALSVTGAGAATATPSSPDAPLAVTATATASNNLSVTWTVPPNNGAAISGFEIYISTGGTQLTQIPILVSTGTNGEGADPTPGAADVFSGPAVFQPQTTYSVTMTATNQAGTSPLSSPPSVVTTPAPAPDLTTQQTGFTFGSVTLGDVSDGSMLIFTNAGQANDTITDFNWGGADPDDFFQTGADDCTDVVLTPGKVCSIEVSFLPGALGSRTATVTPVDGSANAPVISLSGTGTEGYYEATASGRVDAFGDAVPQGDLSGDKLPAPIISITSTGDNGGYWLLDALGDVYNLGDATWFGDTSDIHLAHPIVGMAQTADGGGYWLVASDGGVFAFGDAPFYGSTGAIHLNKPIVGMAVTADGGGYWLVASDGGIFAFGDASFYGSTGALHLNKPIVGMATTPDGGGYRMVATDGGIFDFGDAAFYGSTGGIKLNQPIVGMATTPDGQGYWLDAADGGIFSFGDAIFYGSDGGKGITNSVGIALDGYSTFQASIDVPAARHQVEADRRRSS